MLKRLFAYMLLLIALLFPCCVYAESVPDFLISVEHLEPVWPSELAAGELPIPQIVYHNELLVEGEDYTLIDYRNDQYNLVGKGSFTGTRLITAPRLGRQLTEAPKVSAQNYNGAPIVPEHSTYTVQAWNNILPGTATARFIANGENGYYGAVTTNFDIRQYAPSVKMNVSGSYSATRGSYVSIDDQGLIYLSVYKNGKLIASGNTYIGYSIGLDTSTWEPGVYDFKFTRHNFQYVVANVNGVSQYTKRSTGVSGYSNATLTLLAPPSASEVSPVNLVPGLPADAGASKTYVTLSAQPENATIHADEVVFSTSDPSVATVSGYGEITIHQAGSVVITAEYRGKTAMWDMTFDPLSIENAVLVSYSAEDNAVTMLYRGQLLTQDTDYTVTYEETRENVRLVTVTGTGTFGGSISRAFYVDTGYPLSDDEDLLTPSVPRQFDFDGTTLVANIGPASDIVIPYGVTNIAEYAFSGRMAPQTVTVPETVTQLGYRAFSGCSAHTIHLPDTLTSIGNYAFTSSNITSLSIPESVTSIGSNAFSFCDFLTEIDLPDSITSLGSNTFEYCDALTSVTLPDNLTALGEETFYKCTALEHVTLPSALQDLGTYTFYECSALKGIELPDTLTTIGSDVFSFCRSLGELTFPAGVNYVESAFSYCGSPRIYLNDTLAYTTGISNGKLDKYTFSLYSGILVATPGSRTEASLKALSIPYATPANPNYALQTAADGTVTLVHAAKDLVNATVPSSVTAIALDAFSGCSVMKTLLLPDHITSVGSLPSSWDPETSQYTAVLCSIDSETAKTVSDYGRSFCPPSMPYLELSYYNDRLRADGLREPVTELVLPEGIQELSSNAFENQAGLVSVTLPTSIEHIGYSAFYNCTSLEEIKGLDNVTTIDSYAFCYCDSLKSIAIPDSLTTITRYSFTSCSAMLLCAPGSAVSRLLSNNGYLFADPSYPQVKLNYGTSDNLCAAGAAADATEITIPDGVTEIAYRAFYHHSTLERIVIPESVVSIGSNAFYGCPNLQAVILPENLTSISSRDTNKLFCRRESLTALTLSSKNYSFRDPDYPQVCLLASEDENGSRTYTVKDCNEDAVNVSLPEGTTTIASNAFYNCKQLESLTLPEGLTTIESDAFKNCTALTSLVLPDSITSIASGVLKGKTLYINPESSTGETVAAAGYAFRFRSGYEGLNFVLEAAEDGTRSLTLKSADPALTSIPALPPQTRAIANRAFYQSAITDITLPEGLLTIGSYAFAGSKSLTSIIIPDSVTEIGSDAFYYCSALESATLPENLTDIGDSLFYQCQKLVSVDIPDSVTRVGEYAFYYCSALESITLPENLITIDHYAFYGCDLLTEIHLPETVTSIGNYAFCCDSLTKINIPASVTSIGNGTFSYCRALESIVLPEGITSIGSKAFYGCDNLKVSIPESLTSAGSELGGTLFCAVGSSAAKTLGKSGNKFTDPAYPALKLYYNSDASVLALYDCSSSAEGAIIVPDAVTKLDRYVFYYDTHITSVTLPDNITSIDSRWFYECSFSIDYKLDSPTAIALTKAGMPKYAYDGLTIETKQNTDGTLTITVTDAKNDLTEVIIPQGVTAIGANAFKEHTALRSVSIPAGVTQIGSSAFDKCNALQTINLPEGILSIGSNAFRQTAIASINIPASVTSIGSYAFYGCKSLTELVLPADLAELHNGVFSGCTSLTSVILPQALVSINESAFNNCSALNTLTIPDGVSSIGESAFSGCASLTSLSLSDALTSISKSAFSGCSSLTSVSLPNALSSIGEKAFSGCSSLSSISIPDTLSSIGSSAFSNCSSLTRVSLPDSMTYVGSYAFSRCPAKVYCSVNSDTALALGQNNNFFTVEGSEVLTLCTIKDETGNRFTYVHDCSDNAVTAVIPDGVSQIGRNYSSYAFRNCASLTSVTIPESVTIIDYEAFSGCSSLLSLTLPEALTFIGDYAFKGCSSLTSITIPDGITSLPYNVFNGCSTMTSVFLPDSITSVGSNAFSSCTAKRFCSLDSETSLALSNAGYAFSTQEYPLLSFRIAQNDDGTRIFTLTDCDENATEITIPDFVTAIGQNAFYECSSLTSITLPDGITSIDSYVFRNIKAKIYCAMNSDTAFTLGKNSTSYTVKEAEMLTLRTYEDETGRRVTHVLDCDSNAASMVIPNGIVRIAKSAFESCKSLDSVMIPDSVTHIDDRAFYGCSALASVTIPDSVTTIGDQAFYGCSSLASVTLPKALASIGTSAFSYCEALTDIDLPDSITMLPSELFFGCTSLETVTIPESVTSLGSSLFANCSSLIGIVLPDGITALPYSLFANCSALKSISLPDGITSIGNNLFSNCTAKLLCTPDSDTALVLSENYKSFTVKGSEMLALRTTEDEFGKRITYVHDCDMDAVNAIIPDGVDHIGLRGYETGFVNCASLVSVEIPSSVTSIESASFYGCTSLVSITLPEDLDYISSSAFSGCSALTSITFPKTLDFIGNYAFSGCTALTSVTLPACSTSLGSSVFSGCTSLVSAVLSDGITTLTSELFYNCTSLENVAIPESVTSIGRHAFRNCTSLTDIALPNGITSIGSDAFYDCPAKLFCPQNSETALTLSKAGRAFSHPDYPLLSFKTTQKDDGTRTVTLVGCDKDTIEITVPDFVTVIGQNAFYGCASLKSITLPDSVTSIDQNAFYECASLESITLPNGITSIGSSAFSNCPASIYCAMNSDTALVLAEQSYSFTVKGSEMLNLRTYEDENGKRITYVHNCDRDAVDAIIPDGVEQISRSGYEAGFANCTSLVSVTIPDSVRRIEYKAFYRCTSLTSVTLPEGLESISEYAFYDCAALTSITIPKSLSSLGRYAFNYCTSLTSITLPDDITSIASEAFSGCSAARFCAVNSDTALALGKAGYPFIDPAYPLLSFKAVLDEAGSRIVTLVSCDKSATEIIVPDFVTAIGSRSFSGCTSLTSITSPDGITSVGSYAFDNCPAKVYCAISSDTALALGKAGYTFIDPAYPPLSFKVTPDDDGSHMVTLTHCDKSATEVSVPESVTAIGDQAFYNCTALNSLTLPNGVTSIGNYAFNNCPITHTYSKDSPVALALGQAGYAFADPAYPQFSLKVTLDDAGERMITLNRCDKDMTEVTVPEFIDVIGSNAFYACAALESVVLPDALRSIGSYAFYECDSLTAITIPNSVTEIGSSAFQYCNRLETVSLPDGLTHLSSSIFYSCDALKSLTLPQTLVSIGRCAFFSSGLEHIELPPSLESIAYWAFTGCNLAELNIPPSVKTIPEIIVDSGLKRVFLPAEVTEICENAFGSSLETVYGYSGSTAETWAQAHGYTFIAVDAVLPEEYTTLTGPSALHMDAGMTLNLRDQLTITPQLPVQSYTVTCISSDPSVVQADGALLTFLSTGSAELTVSIAEIPALSLTIPVTVYPPVENFSVPAYIFLKSGKSMDFRPQEITPEGAYRTFTFIYDGRKSKAESFSLYNYSSSSGAFPMTVTSQSGISHTATIVRYKEITDVQIDTPRVMQISDTATPVITVYFDELALDGTVALTELVSSNPEVIRVTGGRQLEALNAGYARISATAPDNSEVAFNIVVDPASSFALPAATKTIRDEAFCGLPIQTLIIPDGCTEIGARAFADCSNLVSVRIPASVTSIGMDAFSGGNNPIIFAPAESAASAYAQENALTVIEY